MRADLGRGAGLTGDLLARDLRASTEEQGLVRPSDGTRLHSGEWRVSVVLRCCGQSPFGPLGPGPAQILPHSDGTFRTTGRWPTLVSLASAEAGDNAAGY